MWCFANLLVAFPHEIGLSWGLKKSRRVCSVIALCLCKMIQAVNFKPFFGGGSKPLPWKKCFLGISLSVNAKRILLSPLACGKHQHHSVCSASQIHSNVELEIFPNGQTKTRMDIYIGIFHIQECLGMIFKIGFVFPHEFLGGGLNYLLIFTPKPWGFMIQFDVGIFFNWVGEKTPPTTCSFSLNPATCLQVFQDAGLAAFLDAVIDGYHATIFAYGRMWEWVGRVSGPGRQGTPLEKVWCIMLGLQLFREKSVGLVGGFFPNRNEMLLVCKFSPLWWGFHHLPLPRWLGEESREISGYSLFNLQRIGEFMVREKGHQSHQSHPFFDQILVIPFFLPRQRLQ